MCASGGHTSGGAGARAPGGPVRELGPHVRAGVVKDAGVRPVQVSV